MLWNPSLIKIVSIEYLNDFSIVIQRENDTFTLPEHFLEEKMFDCVYTPDGGEIFSLVPFYFLTICIQRIGSNKMALVECWHGIPSWAFDVTSCIHFLFFPFFDFRLQQYSRWGTHIFCVYLLTFIWSWIFFFLQVRFVIFLFS